MPETRHSVCALDCPDTCSLLVQVEDGGARRLRGDPAHPVTQGFLCSKVARYLERQYSPQRLRYPQKRAGAKGEGRFERISWDEALDTIAEKLRGIAAEYGPEAILPYSYAGTMGLLNGSGMDRRFFHRLGASRLDRTICSTAGGAALNRTMGFRYGTEPEQFAQARLILAWGANVLGTNVHLWPFIVQARRNGARFYTIDPVKNRTGQAADKHFFIHPGTDTALALGLAHVLLRDGLCDREYLECHTEGLAEFRELAREYTPDHTSRITGIPAGEIEELAREYGTTRPAVIRVNYGVQRSERGAQAVMAVAALPVLTGSWREVGGGLQLTTSDAFQLERQSLERPDLQQAALGREARLVNMSQLGQALTQLDTPPVKGLVVYNSNPAAIAPNQSLVRQGLGRPDLFTVVLEQFQTDTARFADVLLPATTFLEHTDLYLAYGHYYLQLARPALPAEGEARSNVEIFRELAGRMGFSEPCFRESEDEMIRGLLASGHPFLEGITLERLEREHFVRLSLPEPFRPFAEGEFGSTSRKFRFHSGKFAPPRESRAGDPELRVRFPLELVTPKADAAMNSTFGYRPELREIHARLHVNARDAAARNLATGDKARIFNSRGECYGTVSVDGWVPEGVVAMPSVGWGANPNALTSDRLTDLGGGPVFYSCLVQVERAGA